MPRAVVNDYESLRQTRTQESRLPIFRSSCEKIRKAKKPFGSAGTRRASAAYRGLGQCGGSGSLSSFMTQADKSNSMKATAFSWAEISRISQLVGKPGLAPSSDAVAETCRLV